MIEIPYSEIKNYIISHGFSPQAFEVGNYCYIYAVNGNFTVYSKIDIGSNDFTDYVQNLKARCNQRLSFEDNDGATLVRLKAAKAGWTYHARSIELATAKIGSYYSTNAPWISVKYFNSSNQEVTSPGQESEIVKTRVRLEPPFDYEIIGGQLYLQEVPTEDTRLSIIGVSTIPPEHGGSKLMVSDINLRYVTSKHLVIDGRVTKMLKYPYNTLDAVITHSPGYQVNLMLVIEWYQL